MFGYSDAEIFNWIFCILLLCISVSVLLSALLIGFIYFFHDKSVPPELKNRSSYFRDVAETTKLIFVAISASIITLAALVSFLHGVVKVPYSAMVLVIFLIIGPTSFRFAVKRIYGVGRRELEKLCSPR